MRLTFGDALYLRSMDAVDLVRVVPGLAVDAPGKLEKISKTAVRFRMLTFDITDDSAKIVAQLLLFTHGTLDLTGVTIATVHDQGLLAEPLETLAQINALLLCQSHQGSSGLVVKTGIGRKGNSLFLDSGIDVDSLNVLLGDVAITLGCFDSQSTLPHPQGVGFYIALNVLR